jgi:hypothetical protein
MIDPSDIDDLAGLPSWFARAACRGLTNPDVMFDGPAADTLDLGGPSRSASTHSLIQHCDEFGQLHQQVLPVFY